MKTITILQTSDLHGHIFPLHYSTNNFAHVGLGKVATIVQGERKIDPDLLLIDTGDAIQGTPLAYYYAKFSANDMHPVIRILNELSYDAAVVGNHEFNYGLPMLQQVVKDSRFPWLSGNILCENTMQPAFGKPYIVRNIEGVKIAVLGVTTHYIPNWEKPEHIANLTFKDCLEKTKKWVTFIQKFEQPHALIVAYHGGFERDLQTGEPTESLTGENQGYALCEQIEGIDVLLTGHQHRELAGAISGVAIAQPACFGQFVSKIVLTFNNNNELLHKEVDVLSTTHVAANENVLQLASKIEEETQQWLDQPIGHVEGDMLITDPFEVRVKGHPFIDFIHDVQMTNANTTISITSLFTNDGHGLPTTVTMRDIMANYPFPNTLTVLQLQGEDIRAALERSASYFTCNDDGDLEVSKAFSEPKPQHYNYDMWKGIDYQLDIRKPIGQRVTKLLSNGKPILNHDIFEVVMNNYRASGGGDYSMFKGKPVLRDIPIDMTEQIADYFQERKNITAKMKSNWSVIWS